MAAIDYLGASASMKGHTEDWVVQGSLIGRLDRAGIVLPWTHQAVGIVIGGEWRRNALLLDFNPVFESGDLSGRVESRGWIRPGQIAVAEIFGELQVPVVDGPIGRLTMELGFRAGSTAGGAYSGRAGISWAFPME